MENSGQDKQETTAEPAATPTPAVSTMKASHPAFLQELQGAYKKRGKSVIVLTGNTHDHYWCEKKNCFLPLEQTLFHALSGDAADKFNVMRIDSSNGIGFYDDKHLESVKNACKEFDKMSLALKSFKNEKVGDVDKMIAMTETGGSTFALKFLSGVLPKLSFVRKALKGQPSETKYLPSCVIIQMADYIFPNNGKGQMSEPDRQRLVTFRGLIESSSFSESDDLIILVADNNAEVHQSIMELPQVHPIKIGLPNSEERLVYANNFACNQVELLSNSIQYEKSLADFVETTSGLTLNSQGVLLKAALQTNQPITRKDLLEEINIVINKELDGIVRRSTSEHGPNDIVGYKETGKVIQNVLQRCESVDTAVSVIGVWGGNGSGKTYQLEAWANQAGRVCLELGSLRGPLFGQTDSIFEKLYLKLLNYNKVMIMVDEAATAFGSVHRSDTHETEKRLAGNIIKMMTNRKLRGRVLWVLMTARPDELDPDIRRRCQIHIPIFDLEGENRKEFVVEMFKRKGIEVATADLDPIMSKTEDYSADDYNQLVTEVFSTKAGILETLDLWRPSGITIKKERQLQTLLAAAHCTYTSLLPKELKERSLEDIRDEIRLLKIELYGSAA